MKVTHKEKTNIFSAEKFRGFLSGKLSLPDNIFFCAHTGPSMNPTLTAQDLLEIKPFQNGRPRVGDVILFQPSGYDHFVVHRIVSIGVNGIQTRGDNNSSNDPEDLKHDDILGKVIAAQRGSSRRRIAHGFMGRVTGKVLNLRRLALVQAVRFLGPVYRSLCAGGFLQWLIPVRISPQIATFHAATHRIHKLLLGHRIIGSYDEASLQWQIRRPYRMLVDESSLPKPR